MRRRRNQRTDSGQTRRRGGAERARRERVHRRDGDTLGLF
jgi:hypothetical protein